MEAKPVSLGSSLLVPSVQELAKEPLSNIPPRYVRPDQVPITMVSADITVSEIPVIDLQCLIAGDSMGSELERLHSACKDWGFFQVVNHGVNDSLIEKVKFEVQDFFRLPLEEKKKLWQKSDEQEGFGQLFVVSNEQKLDWADMFYISTLPTKLRKPSLFDKLPPNLRETMDAYSLEMKKLSITILAQMAKALNIDNEKLKILYDDGMQSIRMNYYPPCPEPQMAIGLTPHLDADALTLLLQLNEIEGLQIRKDGKWVPVKPLPNAFVVNVGDMMEITSNGVYRSIEHRATVNSTKERLSIATFYSNNLDGEVGPESSLVSPHKPAKFKRVSVEKYHKEFFAQKLSGKSYLDYMRL